MAGSLTRREWRVIHGVGRVNTPETESTPVLAGYAGTTAFERDGCLGSRALFGFTSYVWVRYSEAQEMQVNGWGVGQAQLLTHVIENPECLVGENSSLPIRSTCCWLFESRRLRAGGR
jgi:hypothetical protein